MTYARALLVLTPIVLLADTRSAVPRAAGQVPTVGPVVDGFHVSPRGTSAGTGSVDRPWDLATALAGADGRIGPGDTVWLREGTYPGSFRTELAGKEGAPIVFRQYPSERATIDGTLRADGSYLVFWGFEILQSDFGTINTYGLQANASHSRYVNLIIHDVGTQGVSFWNPGIDSELYGCIVYNTGSNENLDHGVYVHNEAGTKVLRDNVFFNNYARGIQVYASRRNPLIRGVHVEGNVAFNNGTISERSTRNNLLLSAPVLTEDMVAIDNLLFFSRDEGINIRLGNYDAAHNKNVVLRNNYAAGGEIGLQMDHAWERAEIENNTLVGRGTIVRTAGEELIASYSWSRNRFHRDPRARAWRHDGQAYDFDGWRRRSGLGEADEVVAAPPSETAVFVRPNRYEGGRGTIVVYNWGGLADVPVDLGAILMTGDRYEVRNVQDLFGEPVVAGRYDGGAVNLPMAGVEPPAPIGRQTPRQAPRTGPEFDVFLITRVDD